MKTKLFLTTVFIAFALVLKAQLYTPSGLVNTSTTGKIGIGVSNPDATLDIYSPTPWLHLRNNNNVGIHLAIAECNSCWSNSSLLNDVVLSTSMGNSGNLLIQAKNPNKSIKFITNLNNFQGVRMTINHDGRVGIGHTDFDKSSGYLLSVAGKIICEEVRVKMYANWPDFVFTQNYSLRSIYELENYIKENNHLPDVPSAEQVHSEGIDTAEMLRIQMQKIEELTLYVIQLKKENDALKSAIEKITK